MSIARYHFLPFRLPVLALKFTHRIVHIIVQVLSYIAIISGLITFIYGLKVTYDISISAFFSIRLKNCRRKMTRLSRESGKSDGNKCICVYTFLYKIISDTYRIKTVGLECSAFPVNFRPRDTRSQSQKSIIKRHLSRNWNSTIIVIIINTATLHHHYSRYDTIGIFLLCYYCVYSLSLLSL